MSQWASCGRVTPRASGDGHGASVPASIAGLVGIRACVGTIPPFDASARSAGSTPWRSPDALNGHEPESLARLFPFEVIVPPPPQLAAPFDATIVLTTVLSPSTQRPVPGPAFPAIVAFVRLPPKPLQKIPAPCEPVPTVFPRTVRVP